MSAAPLSQSVPLEELAELLPDALLVFDRSGAIRLANGLAEAMFGYAAGELRGRAAAELLPARFRPRHEEHQARFFAQPSRRPMGVGMELRGLRKAGDEFPVEISLAPLVTPEGTLALSAIRDISERQRAAERLAETNRSLENALLLVKQLTGILPICGFCKKIRNAGGEWESIETYIGSHSEAQFTHSFCPECGRAHYPEYLPR